jgi:hypothetical protein
MHECVCVSVLVMWCADYLMQDQIINPSASMHECVCVSVFVCVCNVSYLRAARMHGVR